MWWALAVSNRLQMAERGWWMDAMTICPATLDMALRYLMHKKEGIEIIMSLGYSSVN